MNSIVIPWDVSDMQDLETITIVKKFTTILPNSWPVENPLNAIWRKGSEFLRTLENCRQTGFLQICLQSETSNMDVLLFIQ